MTVLLSLIGFCMIASAIDSTQSVAIPLVLLGYGLVLLASTPWSVRRMTSSRLVKGILVVGAVQLVLSMAASTLVRSQLVDGSGAWLTAAAIVMGLLVVDYTLDRPVTRRLRAPLLLLTYAGIGVWAILGTPRPGIDVWHFQHNAAEAFLSGQQPYDISMPNLYPDKPFYGPGVVREGRVHGFPYPPLSLLFVLPGYLIGDVRWVMLAAHLVLAVTMIAVGRRRGFRPGHHVELITLALLAQPGSLFLLQLAWTEALFAMVMSLLVYASLCDSPVGRPLALAAAWSMKQYSVLLPWSQWRTGSFRLRDFVIAAALTGGVMLPFFLWKWDPTWYSIVEFQFLQPTRADSCSLNAILLYGGRDTLPTWFSLSCAGVVAVWVSSRRSAIRTNLSLTSAAVLLTLFVTTNAFINYLWVATALLAIGIVAGFPVETVADVPHTQEAVREDSPARKKRRESLQPLCTASTP